MAKRKRKTYRRYSFTAFLSGFLCFVITGLIIASFFFPFFGYAHGSDPITNFNGMDFLFFGIKAFIPVDGRFDGFVSFFQRYVDEGGASYLLKPIAMFHDYFEVGVVFFFACSIVFAVVEAILGLFWFITGRLILPKASKVFAWLTTVFFWLSIGLLIGYLYIYKAIIEEIGEYVVFSIPEIPFIFGTLLLFATIAITIVYATAYKNRKLAKKPKPVYEDEVEEVKPQPQKNVEPEPEPEPASEDEIEPAQVKEDSPQPDSWTCPYCGSVNTSKFCSNCGAPKNSK